MNKKLSSPIIAGVDEAGRGALVGPVVAAAVILNEKYDTSYLNDSKKLSTHKRNILFKDIITNSLSYGIGLAEAFEIDKINILQASLLAMQRAVNNLSISPDHILVDGMYTPSWEYSAKAIIKGDQKIKIISAASIIAKVYRDSLMIKLDKKFPVYKFAKHKGYGTKFHIQLIKKYGIIKEHRKTFNPILKMNKKNHYSDFTD